MRIEMRKKIIGNAELYLGDCMDYMKDCDDNAFDLAIVDPEYRDKNQPTKQMRKIGGIERFSGKPKSDYFSELFRVSKDQIIWGANNFIEHLFNTNCFIFWDKKNPCANYSDGELAWTSFQKVARRITITQFGAHRSDHHVIHPTQKPIKLYEWLLTNYAKPDQRILDTHLGSGSSAIAAHYFGCEFVGIELDEDYYNAAVQRITDQTKQLDLLA